VRHVSLEVEMSKSNLKRYGSLQEIFTNGCFDDKQTREFLLVLNEVIKGWTEEFLFSKMVRVEQDI
jgi:hypothetical protein